MVSPRRTTVSKRRPKVDLRVIDTKLKVSRHQLIYGLPYCTLNGGDTEYLISNPGTSLLTATLYVIDKKCRAMKPIKYTLKPNCTQSVLLRKRQPEHAGFSGLVVSKAVVVQILYYRKGLQVAGGELTDKDNLLLWLRDEKYRTYGFGYRRAALSTEDISGSVYVSNPNGTTMSGRIVFYDQKCRVAAKRAIRIPARCTAEYPFPKGRYGYGRAEVSLPAVINVLYSDGRSGHLTAAELVGSGDLLDVPADPPTPGKRILVDYSHDNRMGGFQPFSKFVPSLRAGGLTVTEYQSGSITSALLRKHDAMVLSCPRVMYTDAEMKAITAYVNEGHGLMITTEYGDGIGRENANKILNLFGGQTDFNIIKDPTDNWQGTTYWPIFDYQRNFHSHPIVHGYKIVSAYGATSLAGGSGWQTVIETDSDSEPPNRPVLLARAFGRGRVLAYGDTNTFAGVTADRHENKKLALRCGEWILFRI